MMIDESAPIEALIDETPYRFDMQTMRNAGFSVTTEPFMRRLLLAIVRHTISIVFYFKINLKSSNIQNCL